MFFLIYIFNLFINHTSCITVLHYIRHILGTAPNMGISTTLGSVLLEDAMYFCVAPGCVCSKALCSPTQFSTIIEDHAT